MDDSTHYIKDGRFGRVIQVIEMAGDVQIRTRTPGYDDSIVVVSLDAFKKIVSAVKPFKDEPLFDNGLYVPVEDSTD